MSFVFSGFSFILHLAHHLASLSRSLCKYSAAKSMFLLTAHWPASSANCDLSVWWWWDLACHWHRSEIVMDSGLNLVEHLLLDKLLVIRNLQFWPVLLFQQESRRATYKAWWADQADKFYTSVHCAKHCQMLSRHLGRPLLHVRPNWSFPWWSFHESFPRKVS